MLTGEMSPIDINPAHKTCSFCGVQGTDETTFAGGLGDWVQLARDRGLSWTEIGQALGVSRQAAWERFAKGRPPRANASA